MQKVCALVLVFFLSLYSYCQNKEFSDVNQLADSIRKLVQQENISGLMVGITTSDSILFSGGFGYADIDAKRPVTGRTLFRMASITKMLVALGILNLVQERKLSLNDELKKIAPEVPIQNNWESSDPVRIIHLLE